MIEKPRLIYPGNVTVHG